VLPIGLGTKIEDHWTVLETKVDMMLLTIVY
jgi:hypothetical protein